VEKSMSFLDEYKRQPKLYIDLPSSGEFYSDGVFEDNQFVQIPVFAMSAADEIMTKTPDALFSGKSVVNILKSCIPLLNDPWQLIKTDLEYLLTAIRIASIGNTTDIASSCNKCGETNVVEVNLQSVLTYIDNAPYESSFQYEDLTINIRPITFKQMSDLGIALYQKQKTLYQLQVAEMSQDQRVEQVATLSDEIIKMTTRSLIKYIHSVSNSTSTEQNNETIRKFIEDNDLKISKAFADEITKFVDLITYPAQTVRCAGEVDENTLCDNEYKISYNSDYSSFFVIR